MAWLNASKNRVVVLVACVGVSISLAACVGGEEKTGMSADSLGVDREQSAAESAGDVVAMSGEYQVTREGKLLRGASDYRLRKPEPTELAQVHDNNGAEAFARYFIQVVEYTWDSGDSSLLREVSDPACEWCRFLATKTDERAANDGWVRNVGVAVSEVEPAFEVPDDPGLWHVSVHAKTNAHTAYDGEELQDISEEMSVLHLGLRYVNGRWLVEGAAGEVEEE